MEKIFVNSEQLREWDGCRGEIERFEAEYGCKKIEVTREFLVECADKNYDIGFWFRHEFPDIEDGEEFIAKNNALLDKYHERIGEINKNAELSTEEQIKKRKEANRLDRIAWANLIADSIGLP